MMNVRTMTAQHLANAIDFHERRAEMARIELKRRRVEAVNARRQYTPADLSMIEHRLQCIEGRMSSVERKLIPKTKRRKK